MDFDASIYELLNRSFCRRRPYGRSGFYALNNADSHFGIHLENNSKTLVSSQDKKQCKERGNTGFPTEHWRVMYAFASLDTQFPRHSIDSHAQIR